MMNKSRWAALALVACLLLGGCSPSGSEPPPDKPAIVSPPAVSEPAAPDGNPAPGGPEALPLPMSSGVDWNDVAGQSAGTGGPSPETIVRPAYSFTAYGELAAHEEPVTNPEGFPLDSSIELEFYGMAIRGLRDPEIEQRINDEILAKMRELCAAGAPKAPEELEALAGEYGAGRAAITRGVDAYPSLSGHVLSVQVNRYDFLRLFGAGEGAPDWTQLESERVILNFDLKTGEQLALSDFFFDGADYLSVLNAAIFDYFNEYSYVLKRPFRGLPGNYPFFSANDGHLVIQLLHPNPYIADEAYISIPPDALYPICSILYEDPTPYLAEGVNISRNPLTRELEVAAHPLDAAAHELEFMPVVYAPRLRGGVPAEVMESVNAALDAHETRYASLDYLPPDVVDSWDEFDFRGVYVDYTAMGELFSVAYTTSLYNSDRDETHLDHLTFDLRDGRRLTAADLLVPSDELSAFLAEHGVSAPLDELDSVMVSYGYSVVISGAPAAGDFVHVDSEHFNTALLEGEQTP